MTVLLATAINQIKEIRSFPSTSPVTSIGCFGCLVLVGDVLFVLLVFYFLRCASRVFNFIKQECWMTDNASTLARLCQKNFKVLRRHFQLQLCPDQTPATRVKKIRIFRAWFSHGSGAVPAPKTFRNNRDENSRPGETTKRSTNEGR